MASAANGDYTLMREVAAADARHQLATQMQVRVQSMMKRYADSTRDKSHQSAEQSNTFVTRQITDQSVAGTKIIRTLTGPDGALWVLVGMNKDAYDIATSNALNAMGVSGVRARSEMAQLDLSKRLADSAPRAAEQQTVNKPAVTETPAPVSGASTTAESQGEKN